jgi:serine/threonine protein phosphatase PrpC
MATFIEQNNSSIAAESMYYNNFAEDDAAVELAVIPETPIFSILEEAASLQPQLLPAPRTYMDHACRQAKSGQDFTLTGSADGYDWMVVADGHGKEKNGTMEHVGILRTLQWSSIMEKVSPIDEINKKVAEWHDTHGTEESIVSGSMLAMVRVYSTGIECVTVGDARIAIYIDDKLAHISMPHNHSNPMEVERIKRDNLLSHTEPGSTIKILSPTEITMMSNPYSVFRLGNYRLSSTMSLGHQNATGCEPEREFVDIEPRQRVMIVVYSDGLGDMFLPHDPEEIERIRDMSAGDIVEMALKRWKQIWRFYPSETDLSSHVINRFPPDGEDDISVAVWRNY